MTYLKAMKLLALSTLGSYLLTTEGQTSDIINFNDLIEQEGGKIAQKYKTSLVRFEVSDDSYPYNQSSLNKLVKFVDIHYDAPLKPLQKQSIIFERLYQNTSTSDIVVVAEKPIEYVSDYFSWTLNEGIRIGKSSKVPCYFKGISENYLTIPAEIDVTSPGTQDSTIIQKKEEYTTSMEIVLKPKNAVKIQYTIEQLEVKDIPFTLTLQIDGIAVFHFADLVDLSSPPAKQKFELLKIFDSNYRTQWRKGISQLFEENHPENSYYKSDSLYHKLTGTFCAFQGKKVSINAEIFPISDLKFEKI